MNITRENIDELKVVIKIEINESDYLENYNKSLKTYQRKAIVSGFRPGKVPMGYVLNSHGRSIKFEEINKLSSDAIDKYILENKIDYIFSPTMESDGMDAEHWIDQKDFVYYFNIILRPTIDFDIENMEVEYYDVIPEAEMVENMINETRSQRGEIVPNDSVLENSSINCNVEELNIDGTAKEEGVKLESHLRIEDIVDADTKKKLLGLKVGENVVINPFIAYNNKERAERFLNIENNEEALRANYFLTINEIQAVQLAELNTDFYKSIYPNDDIQTEEQFYERVKKEASTYYFQQTDQIFYSDTIKKIFTDGEYNIPDETLKKAILDFNHKEITLEEVERDYLYYRGSIIHLAFKKYLLEKYNFNVTYEDVKMYAKSRILSQFGSFQDIDEKLMGAIDNYADQQLKNKKQYDEMKEHTYDLLLMQLLKEKIKLNHKTISHKEFVTIVNERSHNHNHNHDHDHDHEHEHEHEHDHEHDHDHHHSH